ncbi:MAG: hypothetical protein ABW003_05830 [Microvirga sp.]
MGDGILAEYRSVVDAAACAVALQQQVAASQAATDKQQQQVAEEWLRNKKQVRVYKISKSTLTADEALEIAQSSDKTARSHYPQCTS